MMARDIPGYHKYMGSVFMEKVAMGIVIKEKQVLLVHRRFPPKLWSPPGGFMDKGETPEETVRREVWEETGVKCKVVKKIYEFCSNQSQIAVYVCKYISGSLQCSYESIDLNWFPIVKLPDPISPNLSVFKKAFSFIK